MNKLSRHGVVPARLHGGGGRLTLAHLIRNRLRSHGSVGQSVASGTGAVAVGDGCHDALRTLVLAGRPLRIYASPRTGPDHPFASFDDLADVAGWCADVRAYNLAQLRRNAPDELHELPDGTLVLSEPVVGGLFLAWVETDAETVGPLLEQWHAAWTDVFAIQLARLPDDEWVAAAREARLRNLQHVPGQVM